MWIKFLYLIWLGTPILFFGFYLIHKLTETKKMSKSNDMIVIRSKFYIQITIFCAICSVITFMLNHFIIETQIPKLTSRPYVLETVQLLLYLLVISVVAPFGGKNKSPETLQDQIQKHGFVNERTRKARDKFR